MNRQSIAYNCSMLTCVGGGVVVSMDREEGREDEKSRMGRGISGVKRRSRNERRNWNGSENTKYEMGIMEDKMKEKDGLKGRERV